MYKGYLLVSQYGITAFSLKQKSLKYCTGHFTVKHSSIANSVEPFRVDSEDFYICTPDGDGPPLKKGACKFRIPSPSKNSLGSVSVQYKTNNTKVHTVRLQVNKLVIDAAPPDGPLAMTVTALSLSLQNSLLARHSDKQVRQCMSVEQQFRPQSREGCAPQPRVMERTTTLSEKHIAIITGLEL